MTLGCALHLWLPSASVRQEPSEYRYTTIHLTLLCSFFILTADGSDTEYIRIGEMPQYMIEQGWQKMGGDFYLDNRRMEKRYMSKPSAVTNK